MNNPQPVQLNFLDAIEARNKGMEQALSNADNKVPSWSAKSYRFMINWLALITGERIFKIEEVRAAAAFAGVPDPPHNRAWGAIAAKAVKGKFIERVGYGQADSVKSHRANVTLWRKI